jgi:pilus assembly protein CpaB
MKPQAVVMLAVAVCCGLLSMLGVRHVLKRSEESRDPVVDVVVAIGDLEPGIPLDASTARVVSVPEAIVPPGAISSLEDLRDRGLKVPVKAGDWIVASKVGGKGEFGAIAKLPPGMATVTIPVDATTSHSGMLQAGNKIDLLLTYDDPKVNGAHQKTITVLEFVEVFAVDAQTYGSEANVAGVAKTLSLLVTPEQGRAVTLASKIGTLSTLMRKPKDSQTADGVAGGMAETVISSEFENLQKVVPEISESGIDGAASRNGGSKATDVESLAEGIPDLLEEELKRGGATDSAVTGPVSRTADGDESWTIEIYEGDTVRREKVRLAVPSTTSSVWNFLKSLKR